MRAVLDFHRPDGRIFDKTRDRLVHSAIHCLRGRERTSPRIATALQAVVIRGRSSQRNRIADRRHTIGPVARIAVRIVRILSIIGTDLDSSPM